MTVAYTLQGFNLHQPEIGFQLMEGSIYASAVSPRRVNLVVPNMHGEIPAWNDPLEATNITVRVRISDPDAAELERKWIYLRSLCMTGQNNPVTMRRETSDHNAFAYVQLLSMSEPDFWCAAGIVDTVMIFHNPYGRWQDAQTPEDQPLSVPGAQQIVVAAMESSAPISNALFLARGPLAGLQVRNPYNDTGFSWAAPSTLSSNQWLLVDTERYQAWTNTSGNWEDRTVDVSRTLLTTGNGMLSMTSIPSLTPGNNSNLTAVSASGQGGTTSLTVRARRTYL